MKNICEKCGRHIDARNEGLTCNNPLCASIANNPVQAHNVSEQLPQQTTETNPSLTQLKIIKGDLFNTVKRVKRTQDLLNFSQSLFWPERNFSEKRQLELKLRIAEHFRESKDIDKTFRELVERTVLAKRWVEEEEYRTILRPELWFNIDRIDGLYFTHGLYGKMLTQRKTIPSYQCGLTVFSEAILNYCESKNVLDIYAYREQFIALRRLDLLQYYYNAVIHIQFINL